MLIQKLDLNKIEVFNPIVENWNFEAKQNEIWHRENDDLCVYVLTPEMIGHISITEIIEDSKNRTNKTLLCILENNKKYNTYQKVIILLTRLLIIENEINIFYCLEDLANYINNYKKTDINILK